MNVRMLSLPVLATAFLSVPMVWAAFSPAPPRQVLDLNGLWQVAEGSMDTTPTAFPHQVVVPGLLDMATPAFADVGKPSPRRQAFWYRRTFTVPTEVPAKAILKIHKAKYGSRILLNGQRVGDHLPCFTPAYLDVTATLKGNGQENELIIRVGADRTVLPPGMPTGWDFEKYLYIPGIYDAVELILTGKPYIAQVQVVPNIVDQTVRIVTGLQDAQPGQSIHLDATISEARSGRAVGSETVKTIATWPEESTIVDVTIPIPDCRLWSPEDPFLYQARIDTGTDAVQVRFGMRSLRFDAATGRARLNGKTYFLRGSNVTLYRFLEDASRGDLPWRKSWVRQLHEKFKSMHWNSLRYCIGFPPDFWYDIADEVGVLIQDEFPIWTLGEDHEKLRAERIIPEYRAWMQERWNQACVVIWDAQNESRTDQTGLALQAVRHLDLSNRPWENGWAEPQSMIDCVEAHPYLFIRAWSGQDPFRLSDMPKISGRPGLQKSQQARRVPILINEYAWLWLTRDGQPTCLTDKVYAGLLGPDSTVAQRRQLYARYLAALTEFWRAHRQCAGVLHFCGLGYSRPGDIPRPEGGATSDHFLDVGKLEFEPQFEERLRDAFHPVGLMLNFWEDTVRRGQKQDVEVYVSNDLEPNWQGQVRLLVERDDRIVASQTQPLTVPGFGREIATFTVTFPPDPGSYTLVAERIDPTGDLVRSLRDFKVVTP